MFTGELESLTWGPERRWEWDGRFITKKNKQKKRKRLIKWAQICAPVQLSVHHSPDAHPVMDNLNHNTVSFFYFSFFFLSCSFFLPPSGPLPNGTVITSTRYSFRSSKTRIQEITSPLGFRIYFISQKLNNEKRKVFSFSFLCLMRHSMRLREINKTWK